MGSEEIIGFCIALLLMGVGVAGSILPGIPSTPVVAITAIAHRLYFKGASASNLVLGLIIGLMVLSILMDYIASMIGAKKMGATWKGIVGAVVGATVGLFFSIPGLILGPFVGAALFEMIGGREWQEAVRAGVGAVIGLFVGALGKMACCVAMTALFAVNVLYRSFQGGHEVVEPVVAAVRIWVG